MMKQPTPVIPVVALRLDPADFYIHRHRLAVVALIDLYENCEPGPYDLYIRLRNTGELAEFNGARGFGRFVADCWGRDPIGATAYYAIARVRWFAARRRAIHAAQAMIRDALDGFPGPDYPTG